MSFGLADIRDPTLQLPPSVLDGLPPTDGKFNLFIWHITSLSSHHYIFFRTDKITHIVHAGDSNYFSWTVLSALHTLRTQWPWTHLYPSLAPIALTYSVYCLLPQIDRTTVDREIVSNLIHRCFEKQQLMLQIQPVRAEVLLTFNLLSLCNWSTNLIIVIYSMCIISGISYPSKENSFISFVSEYQRWPRYSFDLHGRLYCLY